MGLGLDGDLKGGHGHEVDPVGDRVLALEVADLLFHSGCGFTHGLHFLWRKCQGIGSPSDCDFERFHGVLHALSSVMHSSISSTNASSSSALIAGSGVGWG